MNGPMDVATIRDALKVRLATVSGLRPYDTIPDDVQTPAAVVVPDDPFITYRASFGNGSADMHFKVTLLVSRTADRSAQDTLDGYLSAGTGMTSSVFAALEGDRVPNTGALYVNGNPTVDDVVVDTVSDYGFTTVAGKSYVKADLNVRVLARRG